MVARASRVCCSAEPIFCWILAAHWLGCFFFMLGWRSCGQSWIGQTDGRTWVTYHWPAVSSDCIARRSPSEAFSSINTPLWVVYVRGLYWGVATMSSLGYAGGLTAYTEVECLLAIVAQVCGACSSTSATRGPAHALELT